EGALSAAGQILQAAGNQGQKLSVAAALGQIVTGPAEWTGGGGASLLGVPVRQLEGLLPGAAPGPLGGSAAVAKAAEGLAGTQLHSFTGPGGRALTRIEPPRHAALVDEGATQAGTLPAAGSGLLTRMSLAPGMVLGSRYEILSELGAGGMAVVY